MFKVPKVEKKYFNKIKIISNFFHKIVYFYIAIASDQIFSIQGFSQALMKIDGQLYSNYILFLTLT